MILFGLVVVAYFLGAIPFGLIIARSQGVDIRAHGSGNIGATNVYRVMGKSWGLLTFFLDALKGFIPAYFFAQWSGSHESMGVYCGLIAIIGHSFPIFLRFLFWCTPPHGLPCCFSFSVSIASSISSSVLIIDLLLRPVFFLSI